MNQAEKRILHGIYLHRSRVDEANYYTVFQLNWLATKPYRYASNWMKDGNLQELQIPGADVQDNLELQIGMARAALGHLDGAGLIEYRYAGAADGILFEVTVTYQGAEIARKLQTRRGRIDFFYRERKDGILSLLLTVIVSALVAIITTWIKSSFPLGVSAPAAVPAAPHTPPTQRPSPHRPGRPAPASRPL